MAMNNERPLTLAQACRDLRDALHEVFVKPLLPPLTKIVAWLTHRIEAFLRWLDRMAA